MFSEYKPLHENIRENSPFSLYIAILSHLKVCEYCREHEIKQRAAEVKIASKLVSEDEQFKRRKKMYPHLWQEKKWEESLVSKLRINIQTCRFEFSIYDMLTC